MDTLTARGPGGEILPDEDPTDNRIPVRFRIYWAGSDRDGAVTGYYYAVTETTTTIGEGEIGLPKVPGPKPQDYRFTTKNDTTFIFTVDQLVPDREHAFFIYAVDNQGKPDPTPARFFFRAFDRFPPRPDISAMGASATGPIVSRFPDGRVTPPYDTTVFVTDTLHRNYLPGEGQFVPATARLDFSWRGLITQAGTYVVGYKYKLDETEFIEVDSSVTSVSYNTGLPGSAPLTPGVKVFTLRALGQSGSAGETTRRFMVNIPPTTWWYGPDSTLSLWQNTPNDGATQYVDGKSAPISNWRTVNLPGTAMSSDSFLYRPAERIPARRTFYELWKDRIWTRAEFDTVHMNSIVVFWNGGFDPDSRYDVRVDPSDTDVPTPLPPGLLDAERVGSPIGFKSLVITRQDNFGELARGTLTSMYPVFEPASLQRTPKGGAYWTMAKSGQAYSLTRAEDETAAKDEQVQDPVGIVDQVDANPNAATPLQREMRGKVLTFFVNKNAVLLPDPGYQPVGLAGFEPDSLEALSTPWSFTIRGYDVDNYDWNKPVEDRPVGGPTQFPSLRMKLWVTGVAVNGRDTLWTYIEGTSPYKRLLNTATWSPVISNTPLNPIPFATGPLRVWIELCDCLDCETRSGEGRCTTWSIPVNFTRPSTWGPNDGTADSGPGEPSEGRSTNHER